MYILKYILKYFDVQLFSDTVKRYFIAFTSSHVQVV